MRIYVATTLECSAEEAWAKVQTSRLLEDVMRPLLRFVAPRGTRFPERWDENTTIRGQSYLLGFIPLGLHTIHFERIDHHRHRIQTRETNALIPRWDHLIKIYEFSLGRSLYTDEVEIEAGWLTGIVAAFARWFYRHRQRSWQRISQRIASERAN